MEQIKKFLHGKGFALLLTASRWLRLRQGCGRCVPCGQNCKKVWMD